jgi:hypothetical protein
LPGRKNQKYEQGKCLELGIDHRSALLLVKNATLFLLKCRRGLPVNVGYSSCEDKVKKRKEADFTAKSSFFMNSRGGRQKEPFFPEKQRFPRNLGV